MHNLSIAVLYPYTGLPSMDRGAARRLMPLVSLLAENFSRITVLSPGAGPFTRDGVEFVPVTETPNGRRFLELAFKLYDGVTYHAFNRLDIRSRRQWWNFIRPVLDSTLHRALAKVSTSADVILLEYPFWSRTLEQSMGRHRKPVVLTLLDLLSGICQNEWLRRRVHNCELAAARRAQAVVCVTEKETRQMRDEGVDAIHVPHGFVLAADKPAAIGKSDNPAIAEIAGRARSGELVCFFLGSSLIPNSEAAGNVVAMASRCGADDKIIFVTAGACCGPGRPSLNTYSLGPISEKDLEILYSLCTVVLAPLQSGTGASLKVIEGMAQGKILVTTRTGIRGYDESIRDGQEAIVCDDLTAWPDILRRLAADPHLRASLVARGRDYSRQFDYRNVYRPYADIIARLGEVAA